MIHAGCDCGPEEFVVVLLESGVLGLGLGFRGLFFCVCFWEG